VRSKRSKPAGATSPTPSKTNPPPGTSTLERIRAHLARVIADGSSAERKATIEQLIAEIRITADERIIPVFKTPGPGTTDGNPGGSTPVRACFAHAGAAEHR
jgi:site-specific DNA recombinase